MNIILLIAFGLVAVASIIRIVLYLTGPKDKSEAV